MKEQEIKWYVPISYPRNIINFRLENTSRVEGELSGDSSIVFDKIVKREISHNRYGGILPIIEMSVEQMWILRKFNIGSCVGDIRGENREEFSCKHLETNIDIITNPNIENSRFVYNIGSIRKHNKGKIR